MIKAKLIDYVGDSVFMDIDEVKDFIDMDCTNPIEPDPQRPNVGRTEIVNRRFHFKHMDDQENGESIAVYEIGEK